ncbi:MAG: hypothetical protein KKA07_08420, partial [Bacteroidetes bacterium]|nr:hypothetical protein [Bacteroidota bacterium]
MKTKFTIAMIALLVSSLGANAQEKDSVETSISCDLMSRYVWRGSQYSRTPSIQPCFELSYKGFVFGTWGAYSFNGAEGAEADLYVSYSFAKEMFSVLVTDYFLPNEYSDNNYFEYCEEHTGHLLEGTLSFNGTEKLPLSFLVAANFYGADKKKLND